MKRIRVHIDRLVLDGFPRSEAASMAEGLRQEMSRLLADGKMPQPQAAQAGGHGGPAAAEVRIEVDRSALRSGKLLAAPIVRSLGK